MGITIPTEEYFKDGTWGHDGTQWRKLPLTWGYTDRWHEVVAVANAAAGTNDLLTTAVPAGEVWILQTADCYNANSVSGQSIAPTDGATVTILVQAVAVVVACITVTGFCHIALREGDQIRARFTGCILNDTLSLRVWGYKMAVT